jgi:nucleoid-associated protein EbfC
MKNIGNMLKEAQKLQTRMAEMQERLGQTEMSGSSGGGLVTVTLNGKGEMRKVKIDPSLADANEMEMLEDLIVAATNDAVKKVEARIQEKMSSVMGGMQLPPGFKMPF